MKVSSTVSVREALEIIELRFQSFSEVHSPSRKFDVCESVFQ